MNTKSFFEALDDTKLVRRDHDSTATAFTLLKSRGLSRYKPPLGRDSMAPGTRQQTAGSEKLETRLHASLRPLPLIWDYDAGMPGDVSAHCCCRQCGVYMQAKEMLDHLESVLSNEPVEVVMGNTIVEVKPQGVSKGGAVERILLDMSSHGSAPDFILCVGDDRSDEDMFTAIDHVAFSPHNLPEVPSCSCRRACVRVVVRASPPRELSRPECIPPVMHGVQAAP